MRESVVSLFIYVLKALLGTTYEYFHTVQSMVRQVLFIPNIFNCILHHFTICSLRNIFQHTTGLQNDLTFTLDVTHLANQPH